MSSQLHITIILAVVFSEMKASNFDQEIPQSSTTDYTMATTVRYFRAHTHTHARTHARARKSNTVISSLFFSEVIVKQEKI